METLNEVNQKEIPVAMSIIDLLLIHPVIKSAPELYSSISSLKTIGSSVWEVVDELCSAHENNKTAVTSK